MNPTNTKFNVRSFVTIMLVFSGSLLPATGLANHLYGFSQFTTARHAWMAAHNVLGALFVIFAIWHGILNRRTLWNHLRNMARGRLVLGREALLACGIMAVSLLYVGHAFLV
jgi:hypothetical protein